MGKWSAFLVSLIPAGLAGYLCYLLVTIGLSVPDDKMGMMFWGPLGAGFLGCVMAVLPPFGIAIFVRSSPKSSPAQQDSGSGDADDEYPDDDLIDSEFSDDELGESDFASDDDLDSSDFDSDDFEDESSSQFQTAEFDEFEDELSGEFDSFEEEEDDDSLA